MKYTLIAVPALGQAQNTLQNVKSKLASLADVHAFHVPEFKIGTLDALLLLSDDLAKYDTSFEQAVNKTADILSTVVKGQPDALLDKETVDQYINTFQWNTMKYRTDKSLQETTALLNQEVTSMDNMLKTKMNTYTQNKNALQQLQRKQTGNLSVRSLNGIVKKQHCVLNSEYLTTLFVAVPKALEKEWCSKYETLTSMVVPRSSVKIDQDDDFILFSVTVFQRVADEFAHKARESRFTVRDFKFDEEALQRQQQELEEASEQESEQQRELIRLSRTQFAEMFGAWVHLKALRIFVESVLRYGLPPDFAAASIHTDAKTEKKVDEVLIAQYGHLGGVHGLNGKKEQQQQEELLDHELQSVNGTQYRPYVQFELNFELERR
ncbi:hypothetical protein BCR43DRAFT_528647 [Syncephalastrum racemosum]|uniref:V-type proton ATPase subunit C n=1 Tax=Syncephalastrum racemosum TaxID=13706 RepID=A0A1X2HU25_SYNRA|nr:hypothetical protein BCR43DRAFT_528647 [Syncephalastrum racemosum]